MRKGAAAEALEPRDLRAGGRLGGRGEERDVAGRVEGFQQLDRARPRDDEALGGAAGYERDVVDVEAVVVLGEEPLLHLVRLLF